MTKGDETLGSDLLEEFWRWAVAQYEDVQVREGLLELQESAGLIILEAMFLAWLGHRGQAIGEEDQRRIRMAITPWVEGVVLPLRRQRQAWTDMPSMITNRRPSRARAGGGARVSWVARRCITHERAA